MPSTKFLFSFDPKTSPRVQKDLEPGLYDAILLRIAGTTDTGQTLVPGDVGRFALQRQGQGRHDASFDFYHNLNNRFGGFIEKVNPTAGATAISAIIPFQIPGLNEGGLQNVLHVRDSDEADIELTIDTTTLGTRFGGNAASFEVYGIMNSEGAEFYQTKVFNQDQVLSAGRLEPFSVQSPNVNKLFVTDASGVLDTVQIVQDDQTKINKIKVDVLNVLSDVVSQIEASSPQIMIDLAESGTFSESNNQNTNVELTATGAGTAEIVVMSLMPGLDSASSIQALVNRVSARVGQEVEPSLPVGIPGLTD